MSFANVSVWGVRELDAAEQDGSTAAVGGGRASTGAHEAGSAHEPVQAAASAGLRKTSIFCDSRAYLCRFARRGGKAAPRLASYG